jgi:hypothetical protein
MPGVAVVFGEFQPPLRFHLSPRASYMLVNLSRVSERLGSTSFDVVVYASSEACRVTLRDGGWRIGACRRVAVNRLGGGSDWVHVLLYDINETVFRMLSEKVTHGLSGADALAEVTLWLELNATYGSSGLNGVLTPLQFLELRRGVCIDYGIFTVAALLAAGYHDAYILMFGDNPLEAHAAAAAVVDGHLFIVDQHWPPTDFEDYVTYGEHSLPPNTTLLLIRVHREGGHVEADGNYTTVENLLKRFPDSWPPDSPDETLAAAVAEKVARDSGAKLRLCSHGRIDYQWPALRLYTPIFGKWWATILAWKIEETLQSYGIKPECIHVYPSGPDTLTITYD